MTALYEENFDVHEPVEVHWNSSTILAIFFAASLVSAVFFGLGYSFGGAGTSKRPLTFNSSQASSEPAGMAIPVAKSAALTAPNKPSPMATPGPQIHTLPPAAVSSTPPVASPSVATSPTERTLAPVLEKKIASSPAMQHDNSTTSAKSSGHIMVQVGAIGNRKDADRLVAELRKKGFHAAIYPQKNDKYLHVQIGPFKDVSQAKSKRHQVMASGFHAILKSTS
jgi:DedD protein